MTALQCVQPTVHPSHTRTQWLIWCLYSDSDGGLRASGDMSAGALLSKVRWLGSSTTAAFGTGSASKVALHLAAGPTYVWQAVMLGPSTSCGHSKASFSTLQLKTRGKALQSSKSGLYGGVKRNSPETSGELHCKESPAKREIPRASALKPTRSTEPLTSHHSKTERVKERPASKARTAMQNDQKLRKKRVTMPTDQNDTSYKRRVDGYPLPGEEVLEKENAEKPDLSRNAQFRSIVPVPKLLQYIDRHLLGRRRVSEWQKAGYDIKIMPAPLDNIPFAKKSERQPIQEELFRHKLKFAAAAKIASSVPPVDIPEVAFAGRSNVGKSSLVNALTRQWGVARTSDKPGLTQSINFFRLGGRMCLVDLPGYGFAYAKETTKEAWEELVKEFVTTRGGLKRVCLLVDSKWGLKLGDEQLIQLMESAGTKYQIVLTKTDTILPIDLARRVTQIQEVFKSNKHMVLPVMMVSSKTGEGLHLLRANLAKLANPSLI